MATFVTSFTDSEEFFEANGAAGNSVMGGFFSALYPLGSFADGERGLDEGSDQTAFHRTGIFSDGDFHLNSGTGTLDSTTSWNVNGVTIFGEGFVALYGSNAGFTIAPPTSNNFAGTVNTFSIMQGSPSDGFFMQFDGAIALSSASSVSPTYNTTHIFVHEAHIGEGFWRDGTINGSFAFNSETEAFSGTITSIAINVNGNILEASGFSINATTFFNADTAPEMESLFGLILAGNDAVTGSREGGVLSGYAGNDVLTAGADFQILAGGAGNDIYDTDGFSDINLVEAAGQGTDTVRSNQIGESVELGANFENAILNGQFSSAYGNELVNVLVGNSSSNELDGGAGADSMVGGGGEDSFYVDNIGDKISAEADDGTYDEVYSTVTWTLGANFEDLSLGGDVAANGTGNATANEIEGNSAANVLTGLGGDDTLIGEGGNDKLDAGDGDDWLQGNDGSNTLLGGAGSDYLEGGGGETDNDLMDGGAGNDYLQAYEGANTMLGGAGEDSLYTGSGNDKLDGGDGGDYLQASDGANTVLGGAGNDEINSGSGNDFIDGGAGNDDIYASGGANTVLGGAGNDYIDTGSENDRIDGGDGDDEIYAGNGANTIFGGGGNDVITSQVSGDIFDGGAGIDTHVMNAGEVTITLGATTENLTFTSAISSEGTGNALANIFQSGEGDDSFNGKGGNDTYYLNGGDSASEDTSGGGVDLVVYSGSSTSFTLGNGIDNLRLNGDSLSGAGNTLNNVLTSGEGTQQFDGKTGNDTYNVQTDDYVGENDEGGGGGNDLAIATLYDGQGFNNLGAFIERLTLLHVGEGTIYGTGNSLGNVITGAIDANNNLYGGEGDTGADTLIGGALDDNLYGGDGADSLVGGAGNDELYGDTGSDKLDGGAGNDWLDGGNDAGNTLIGGAGDDDFYRYLQNTAGITTLIGTTMTDTGGSDTVWFSGGGDSNDSVFNLNLATQAGFGMIDNLNASEAGGHGIRFNFTGNGGNNMLMGADGADTLNGGAGNDWLDGRGGVDVLIGGLGDDSFVVALTNTIELFEGTPTGFGLLSLNASEVSDTGGSDTVVLTGGAGSPVVNAFTYDIGANTQNPFENVDASGVDSTVQAVNLIGNDAGNRLIGTSGSDTMGDTLTGGLGNDTYGVNIGAGESGTDVVVETDTLSGAGHRDLIVAYLQDGQGWSLAPTGNIEDLTLVDISEETTLNGYGNELANRITGDSHANNYLYGAGGADTIIGGAGDDTLDGSSGSDSLVGGLGNDEYRINLKDTPVGALSDAFADTGGIDTLTVYDGEGVTSFTYTLAATLENLDLTDLSINTSATGNAAANEMVGSEGNDKLDGAAGNDSIDGWDGADTILGGAGDDYLDGGEGVYNDSLDGGAGNDSLWGAEGNDTLSGGDGNDDYVESTGDDTYTIAQAGDQVYIDGDSGGIDTLIVKALVSTQTDGDRGEIDLDEVEFIENAIYTGTGRVEMYGNDLNNKMTANTGDDYLDGGEGSDTLIGGAGNDWGYGGTENGNDSLQGDAGNDTLDGGEGGNDKLSGGEGNDSLNGGAEGFDGDFYYSGGNDSLDGGAGNDVLDGGEGGNDTLIGGLGDDRLFGGSTTSFVFFDGDPYQAQGGADGNDSINGGAGNDNIDGGEGGADTLMGDVGNDSLFGGSMSVQNFEGMTWFTPDGNDFIDGGTGNDSIDGGEGGADTLNGGAGDDRIDGGEGSMFSNPGDGPGWEDDGADKLSGGAGNDSIDGGEGGNDTLKGGDGNDSLYGGSDDTGDTNDSLQGDAGNDTLDGGEGGDILNGGAGSDTYFVDNGNDQIVGEGDGESDGIDTVFVSSDYFEVGENIEKIVVTSGSGSLILSNLQANSITGGAGNDLLVGGGGNDTVTGGGGADEFVLGWGTESVQGDNVMAIQDFHFVENGFGGDSIGLSTFDGGVFSDLFDGDFLYEGSVVNGTEATGESAQLIYTYGNATTAGQLFYDADGTGDGEKVLVATFAVGSKPAELHENNFTSFSGIV